LPYAVHEPDDAAQQHHWNAFYGNPNYIYDGSLEWQGLLRKLDREESNYRD